MSPTYSRTILGVVLATLLLAAPLAAGGSTYSRYGIGDILYANGGRAYAFGGASISLIGEGFINEFNPAGLAGIQLTRFSGDFSLTHFRSTSDEGTANWGHGGFAGAAFAIPIDTANGVVLSLQASPYSVVGYAVSAEDSTSLVPSHQTYTGSGGISQLAIGLSASLTQQVHVGAKLQYYFGTLHQYATSTFDDDSYTSSTFDRTTHYSGFGFTGGIIVDKVGELLGVPALTPLTVGAVFQSGWHADLSEEEIVATTDTNYRRSGAAVVPSGFGFGASFLASHRYLISADVFSQSWGSATVDGVHPDALRNSLRAALGLEVLPERAGDSYWKRVAYRFGAYTATTYLQLNGQGINESGVTAGLGLPMGPDARINLALQVASRGTTTAGLQKDLIVRLTLGVTATELWFMTFPDE